jgi:hypothetical protein
MDFNSACERIMKEFVKEVSLAALKAQVEFQKEAESHRVQTNNENVVAMPVVSYRNESSQKPQGYYQSQQWPFCDESLPNGTTYR